MIQLQWHFVRYGGILFGNFVRILAEAIFAEAILTAFPFGFSVHCCLQPSCSWFGLSVTVVFDNHFESAQLLILHSAVADLSVGLIASHFHCISFRF